MLMCVARWVGLLGLFAVALLPQSSAATQYLDCKVLVVPTDGVNERYAGYLADQLARATGLPVKLTTMLGIAEWAPFGDLTDGVAQYPGEQLMQLAAPVVARLRATYGNGLVIILTGRDINGSDRRFRFLFAQHDHVSGISLVSAARMLYPGGSEAETQQLIATRLFKFMLRAVGEHLYKLPRTTDIGSVMYSPIMSLDDLDAMGLRLDGGACKPPDRDDGTPVSRFPADPQMG